MSSQPAEVKQPLHEDITEEEIQKLIAEKERNGAKNCRVITENDQRFLVCVFPPL